MKTYPPLYRDPASATGLSFSDDTGLTQIATVTQLPQHRVEVHSFWSADSAALFVAGMCLIGGGNSIVWERREGEGLVLIAFLQDDRPFGDAVQKVVPLIDHPPAGEDGRRVAAFTKSLVAERNDKARKQREIERVHIDALAALGIEAVHGNWAQVGLRICGSRDQDDIWLTPTSAGWQLEIKMQDTHVYLWESPLDFRLSECFLPEWKPKSKDGGEWQAICATLNEVPGAVCAIRATERDLQPALLEVWRERSTAAEAKRKAEMKAASAERRKARRAPLYSNSSTEERAHG